jgi:hypothetical protein
MDTSTIFKDGGSAWRLGLFPTRSTEVQHQPKGSEGRWGLESPWDVHQWRWKAAAAEGGIRKKWYRLSNKNDGIIPYNGKIMVDNMLLSMVNNGE